MPRIRSDEIAIEKSPKYLIANRAPKRIKNLNKDIKDRFKLVILADIHDGTFRGDFLDGQTRSLWNISPILGDF